MLRAGLATLKGEPEPAPYHIRFHRLRPESPIFGAEVG